MMKRVVLVNESDQELGWSEKLEAHQKGLLHRAFSILVFNRAGELLLQKRAEGKYHSGGLWTNTCCSHPAPGEELQIAAKQRLIEEMGFSCDLLHAGSFIYRCEFSNSLVEHELDHVLVGQCEASPKPDPEEVSDWKWITLEKLEEQMKNQPNQFTYWFKELWNRGYCKLS